MRVRCLLAGVVFLSLASPAQDWQDCKPTGDYSFNDVKGAVHRVTSSGIYSGWDVKTTSNIEPTAASTPNRSYEPRMILHR
jgi:hypothetical protein